MHILSHEAGQVKMKPIGYSLLICLEPFRLIWYELKTFFRGAAKWDSTTISLILWSRKL
jgi:hypothetical protein